MNPLPGGFSDEHALFRVAQTSERAKRSYRDWMEGIAAEEVERVIVLTGSPIEQSLLLRAAMEPFDKAFAKYQRRIESTPVDYTFSDYYRWWARQCATKRAAGG